MKTRTLLAIFIGLCIDVHARTWTSSDGRAMEAEFVRGDDKSVTIKRGAKEFTLPLDKVSQADRDYVTSKLAEAKQPVVPDLGVYAKYATGEWVKGEEEKLPFQINAPATFAGGKRIPLVVFLHGVGATGNDNEKQVNVLPKTFASADNQAKRPCIVIAPQCPLGRSWPNMTGEIIALTKFIAKHLPVDPQRIYISGYSMGGFGVWAVLAEDAKLYAAAIPISGGGNPDAARKMKDVPIWNFHGDVDDTVSVTGSRAMVEALKKVKGRITYTEMAGEGHGIPTKVVRDEKVQEWLFSQKRE